MKKFVFSALLILFAACLLTAQEELPQGVINGKFSISADKQVYFSHGNLQYQATTDSWRFAHNQWDMMGKDNANKSPDYSGWTDLFAWGTGDYPNHITSCYCGSFPVADWGKNDISNTEVANWYTLTKDEWKYLFKTRNTTSGMRFAKATVGDTPGMILLPDEWDPEVTALQGVNSDGANYMTNQISHLSWEKDFEPNGAVFLPADGNMGTMGVGKTGSEGWYWSRTKDKYDNIYAHNVYFSNTRLTPDATAGKATGLSVRLVCPADDIQIKEEKVADAKVEPKPTVYRKFSVADDKQVCFSKGNLQYQPSTGIWRFAKKQWYYVDRLTGKEPSECVWADKFGWGTGANPALQSPNAADYPVFFDWGRVDISNGENKEWFTLSDEEWNYLLNTRNTASGIRYAKASVNCVGGLIILPDDWDPSVFELAEPNRPDEYHSNISEDVWETVLEPNGAIFLPAAGYRRQATILTGQSAGYYWSSTKADDANAFSLLIAPGNVLTSQINGRYLGYSVRLVFVPEEEE